MPFLLTIRHGVENAGDAFGRGDVRRFDSLPIRIGGNESCACNIEASDAPPEVGVLQADGTQGRVCFSPAAGVEVFVNDKLLSGTEAVRSGDEIRVGHWLIRFHRLYGSARRSRSANMLSVFAKVSVVLLLLAEVSIVFWIPAQARREFLWHVQLVRLRSSRALDHARKRVRGFKSDAPALRAIASAIETELDARARYLREHRDSMSVEQHQAMAKEIERLSAIVLAAKRGKALQAIPKLRTVETIGGVLNADTSESKRSGKPK
ncbi:MAG: hypothetical protein KAI66_11955 [Lentisphaeria bacterium]|nr:hypothetical protein [Lentisphaeria bacterium]